MLYLLRSVPVLAFGPGVPGALPLQQLAGNDAQPLARLALAWIPAGASAALALAMTSRASPVARAIGVGAIGWMLLVLAGAGSDAAAISASVPSHLPQQLTRAGTWVATALLVSGTLLVRGPDAPPLRAAGSAPSAP